MADQDFTFNEGIDPSSTWGVHASVLLQLIREAKPNAYRGMLIYSAATPVVTGSYAWQKRCAWINTTDWHLYLYNNTLSSWVDVSAAISDGAINRTAMFASKIITAAKLVGEGTANVLFKVGTDGTTVELGTAVSCIPNGSLPYSKLASFPAWSTLVSLLPGAPTTMTLDNVVLSGLALAADGCIEIKKIQPGTAGQILSMFGAIVKWQNLNDVLPDNGIEQKKIKSQTTVVASASGVVTIDASLGDNFFLTLTENVTGFTVTNLVDGKTIQIKILQGGAGGYTVVFTGIHWPASTAPVITATLAHYDIVSVTSFSGIKAGAVIANFNA